MPPSEPPIETFEFTAEVLLPFSLPIDRRQFPMSVTISDPQLRPRIGNALELEFVDATHLRARWSLPLPYSQDLIHNSVHALILGDGRGIDIAETLRGVLFLLFIKLAYESGSVGFLDAFRHADPKEVIPRVDFTVCGESLWTEIGEWPENRGSMPIPLAWEEAKAALLSRYLVTQALSWKRTTSTGAGKRGAPSSTSHPPLKSRHTNSSFRPPTTTSDLTGWTIRLSPPIRRGLRGMP